jgi:hypothetical protein
MPGPVLGLRPHVEHDDVAPRQPLVKICGGKLLDPVRTSGNVAVTRRGSA